MTFILLTFTRRLSASIFSCQPLSFSFKSSWIWEMMTILSYTITPIVQCRTYETKLLAEKCIITGWGKTSDVPRHYLESVIHSALNVIVYNLHHTHNHSTIASFLMAQQLISFAKRSKRHLKVSKYEVTMEPQF